MIVLDVGNSEIDIGFFHGRELQNHWHLPTRRDLSDHELHESLNSLLQLVGLNVERVERIAISSVVPQLNPVLATVFKSAQILFVDHQLNFSFKLALDNPTLTGADRLVNAEAVAQLYGKPAIIIDAGTATTFGVLSAQAKYLGGAIAPGMHTGAQALIHRASKLSALNVDFDALPAAHFLGKNTADALRSGIVNAHALMIDAMVERLKEELHLPKEVKTIGTGGVMNSLAPLLNSIQHFDPCLTLKGLMLLAETNFPLNPLKERALSL